MPRRICVPKAEWMAIEAGLVKIPQLAHSDPSGEEQAAYFNIWRWIMSKLTAAEKGGKKANAKPEAVLRYAEHPIRLLAYACSPITGTSSCGPSTMAN